MSRTLEQRTNLDGYPKAGELIEMSGLEDLEASQRAVSNLLYQNAHDSGRFNEIDAVFEIPMATLRSALSKHESGDRLRESLVALMADKGRGLLRDEVEICDGVVRGARTPPEHGPVRRDISG